MKYVRIALLLINSLGYNVLRHYTQFSLGIKVINAYKVTMDFQMCVISTLSLKTGSVHVATALDSPSGSSTVKEEGQSDTRGSSESEEGECLVISTDSPILTIPETSGGE